MRLVNRTPRWPADVCGALVVALAVLACVAASVSGRAYAELDNESIASNFVLGLALGLAAYPIARLRSKNPVGWLLMAGGLGFELSAAGRAALDAWAGSGSTAPGWRLVGDVTSLAWPVALVAALPMTLLLFPDGVLPGPRWRPLLGVAVVNALAFETQFGAGAETASYSNGDGVRGYVQVPWADASWVGVTAGAATVVLYLAGIASLVVRYRRGEDRTRQQVLWLLMASIVMFSVFLLSDVTELGGFLVTPAIAAVPAAIAIAILRHQLLDIRLVVSRSLAYLILTGVIVAGYVMVIAGTEQVLSSRFALGPPAVATLVVVAAFNPVRGWLQRRIDRLFYGSRGDPMAVVAELGDRLGSSGLSGALEGLCISLRLPWALVSVAEDELARFGDRHGNEHVHELAVGGATVGVLIVGLRRGERTLSPSDQRLVALTAAPLAVAVQATVAAAKLSEARQALVTAREEERRRLGRDLHDELGPMLTSISLKAEAARRLSSTKPEEVAVLTEDLRRQAVAAVEQVRILARGLRPAVLDSLGLLGALQEYATTLLPLRVDVEGDLPALPAAVEVAAYRIATEALTNVVRHARARCATVCARVHDDRLALVVTDDGTSRSWSEGVGLASMRERVAELGGSFAAGPQLSGGVVEVTFPCGAGAW